MVGLGWPRGQAPVGAGAVVARAVAAITDSVPAVADLERSLRTQTCPQPCTGDASGIAPKSAVVMQATRISMAQGMR